MYVPFWYSWRSVKYCMYVLHSSSFLVHMTICEIPYVRVTQQFLLGTHSDLWNTVCTCYTAVPSWYTWRSDWIIEVTWNTICMYYTSVPSWYTWRFVKYRMYVLHSSSFLVYMAIWLDYWGDLKYRMHVLHSSSFLVHMAICEIPYVRVTQQFLLGTHGDQIGLLRWQTTALTISNVIEIRPTASPLRISCVTFMLSFLTISCVKYHLRYPIVCVHCQLLLVSIHALLDWSGLTEFL